MTIRDNLIASGPWELREERFDQDQLITTGSNFMIGNGYIGYRGTFPDDRREQYVACIVTDTWDNADGAWSELVNAPNGLLMEVIPAGLQKPLSWREAGIGETAGSPDGSTSNSWLRTVDIRNSIWRSHATWPDQGITLREERYPHREHRHILMARTEIVAHRDVVVEIRTGIDGDSWNLKGEHLPELSLTATETPGSSAEGAPLMIAHGITGQHRYDVVVALAVEMSGGVVTPGEYHRDYAHRCITRSDTVSIPAGTTVQVVRCVGIVTTNDLRDRSVISTDAAAGERPSGDRVEAEAVAQVRRRERESWEETLRAHTAAWDEIWHDMDVKITGDPLAQFLLRYNIYHNIIATPLHSDHLPIGARGLSCQAYQGAAFWDQEVFNFPHYLYTRPQVARNILTYRYRTLDGARKKARDLGYRGAFYAWVSGETGEEICPSWFFKDVLTGRPIRNHFNVWQIHISPDILWALHQYLQVTGDEEFFRSCGGEIAFEIARFLASRVHFRIDRQCYEIIRLLGPDEYHENVDNNYFTNWQTRFACATAAAWYRRMAKDYPADLARIAASTGLQEEECAQWEDIAARLYVAEPDPETGLIEQFQGFFDLEDVSPAEVKTRLQDPGEYWGWPNGVAVHTQVSKQADVLQLFMLHRDAEEPTVVERNWDYYEQRTQHGSSLSYAVYGITAARLGRTNQAYDYFMRSSTVDLYNTGKAISGGTFIGGIHTAACGAAWQVVVHGFAGMSSTAEGIILDPHLPAGWQELSFVLRWRTAVADVTITPDGVSVTPRPESGEPLAVEIRTPKAP